MSQGSFQKNHLVVFVVSLEFWCSQCFEEGFSKRAITQSRGFHGSCGFPVFKPPLSAAERICLDTLETGAGHNSENSLEETFSEFDSIYADFPGPYARLPLRENGSDVFLLRCSFCSTIFLREIPCDSKELLAIVVAPWRTQSPLGCQLSAKKV